MKVALIARKTLYAVTGGDTFQVLQTAKYLNQLGIETDIKLTNEKINYTQYDLLHFFNLTRPADIARHIHKTDKPFALSPIWINYSEYDKQYRKGFSGLLFKLLSAYRIEYFKAVARGLKGKDMLPGFSYLIKGHKKIMKTVLKKSAIIFPNSYKEYEQITSSLSIRVPFVKVPNGVEPALFKKENDNKDPRLVICVARIEGIKNQINLIKALNHTPYTLMIIGNPGQNQYAYYQDCKKIAAENVVFINHLPQHELVPYYRQAKVHILPSWFESCGLSSLEAALMGCNVVITQKGFASEYFGDMAFYCDPSSPSSILKAVEQASIAEPNTQLQENILASYTWRKAADKTLEGYRQIISV